MSFQNVIFDLYGTLIDIRTDEQSPGLWAEMARVYAENGRPNISPDEPAPEADLALPEMDLSRVRDFLLD